jgi:hypothetical protein
VCEDSSSYEPSPFGCICKKPKVMGSDGNCYSLISNCRQPDLSDLTCLSCNPGYGLSYETTNCFDNSLKILNCLKYDVTNNLCISCSNGFTPNVGNTACVCNSPSLPDIAGTNCYVFATAITSCLKGGANGRCSQCSEGKVPTVEGSSCVTTITNC